MNEVLLDTNALIALACPDHPLVLRLEVAIVAGSRPVTSALAWHEFVRGPVSDEQIALALEFLDGRILPLLAEDAERAAGLYNATGRRRGSTADCLIAATAIRAGAALLTADRGGFEAFAAHGLSLA